MKINKEYYTDTNNFETFRQATASLIDDVNENYEPSALQKTEFLECFSAMAESWVNKYGIDSLIQDI